MLQHSYSGFSSHTISKDAEEWDICKEVYTTMEMTSPGSDSYFAWNARWTEHATKGHQTQYLERPEFKLVDKLKHQRM